ncbi:heme biosynthesis HemY N-terminal domain-containing protein [Aliidiomarina soli]|uniref:HemY N-terminal domain-containing protein n=1 Tax=Aliidiomarina soli TaxID=1928574 RepID=A0A432WEV5_9GAMM|nr:heme biosynthesis HemY N-terminal domain-containing protein [Aliidiomarina soli]RUO32326.1 hypothetical protein CWE14_09240 [Aliidiomarina soli]
MVKALILLLIVLAGFIAGPLFSGQTGYVLIVMAGYQIETSVVVLVLLILAAVLLIWLLDWLIKKIVRSTRRGSRWASQRRERKAHEQFTQALQQLTAGDYEQAQKHAERAASLLKEPHDALLLAATSARLLKDDDTERRLLEQASDKANPLLALQIQHAASSAPDAGVTAFKRLLSEHPGHTGVTRAAAAFYLRHNRHELLFELLPALENDRALLSTLLSEYQRKAVIGYFTAASSSPDLQQRWRALHKKSRQRALVRLAYAAVLDQRGEQSASQSVLIKGLQKQYLTPAELLYSPFTHTWQTASDLTGYIEAYIKGAPQDADAIALLGVLYLQQGDSEPAQRALRTALSLHSTPYYYRLLGDAYLASGHSEKAVEAYKEAQSYKL